VSPDAYLEPTEQLFRHVVLEDLDRIIGELPQWPSIAMGIAAHLRDVVAQWPDVTIHNVGQLNLLDGEGPNALL
jgi:hypothetical protein